MGKFNDFVIAFSHLTYQDLINPHASARKWLFPILKDGSLPMCKKMCTYYGIKYMQHMYNWFGVQLFGQHIRIPLCNKYMGRETYIYHAK